MTILKTIGSYTFKMVNCMLCGLYLNKALIKKIVGRLPCMLLEGARKGTQDPAG